MTLTLALMIAVAAAPQTAAGPIAGSADVSDGDSLTIGNERIRLFGIDAPELHQSCSIAGKPWQCGEAAAAELDRLVAGKDLRCVRLGHDKYDRTVARCITTSGVDINQTMVENGYAIAFRKYALDYVAAEQSATLARRGLWAGTFETPGDYRAEVKGSKQHQSKPRQPGSSSRPASARAGCVIKGNHSRRGEWIYHLPGMPYYEQTRAEALFCSEAEAQAAGYRRALVRLQGASSQNLRRKNYGRPQSEPRGIFGR